MKGVSGRGTRVTNLRLMYLPKLGAFWRGTEEEFLEFLIRTIPQMPDNVQSAMQRYYIDGETQRMTALGRPESEDSRYYLHLVHGRAILATLIRVMQNDKRPMKLLEMIYGR